MSVAALEQQLQPHWGPEQAEQQPELPLIINVAEMMEDQLARKRAERLIRSVGSLVLEAEVAEIPSPENKIVSLMDAIHLAAEGDETARKMVETNARTDAIERTIKSGHVTRVELDVDETGAILQHNQYMENIQANALSHASDITQMRRRVEAETRNAYRIEDKYRHGLLEDYYFIVFSRAADDMDSKSMREVGFFEDTMSMAIQATTVKNGKLVTETAFVAGVNEAGGDRYDHHVVAAIGDILQVDLNKPATETVDTPILIHKDMLPNGVVDLYWLSESLAGIERPYEEYLSFKDCCLEREKGFETQVHAIVTEIIQESSSIVSPKYAVKRLNKISGKHMVEKAVEDVTINPRVFGAAAPHIEEARQQLAAGNIEVARTETNQAILKDESRSCPTGGAGSTTESEGKGNGETSGDSDQFGSLEFDCPKCRRTNRRPRGMLIPNCQKCGADVSCK